MSLSPWFSLECKQTLIKQVHDKDDATINPLPKDMPIWILKDFKGKGKLLVRMINRSKAFGIILRNLSKCLASDQRSVWSRFDLTLMITVKLKIE